MAYSVIKKELSTYISRKYPRTCLNNKTESTIFFLFAVVFLQPFCSLSLSLFLFQSVFLLSPFLFLFLRIIYYGFFYHFLHPRVDQVVEVPFFLLLLSFLESSILSCKAACLLFRHHLHINAARGLTGQHLMRRQQYPRYLFSLTLVIYMIFPHLLCYKVCPRRYPKGLISLLATSDRSSDVIIVLGHGQILLRHSLLLFGV